MSVHSGPSDPAPVRPKAAGTLPVNPTVRLIATLSNLVRGKIDSLDCIAGLTPAQNGILHFILSRHKERDLFQKDVEEEFNLRRPTATEILKLMEKRGLIYREEASHDARCKKIIATEKGAGMEEQVLRDILEMEHLVTRGIPQRELEAFIATGMKMINNLM